MPVQVERRKKKKHYQEMRSGKRNHFLGSSRLLDHCILSSIFHFLLQCLTGYFLPQCTRFPNISVCLLPSTLSLVTFSGRLLLSASSCGQPRNLLPSAEGSQASAAEESVESVRSFWQVHYSSSDSEMFPCPVAHCCLNNPFLP